MATLTPHVTATETEHGLVLLDQRTGRYWQLNGTAAMVLRCLLAGGTTESAREQLRARYPSHADRVDADVDALLDRMHDARLVR